MNQKERAQFLADAHWEYTGKTLELALLSDEMLALCGHLYKAAATHFYGHAWEDFRNGMFGPSAIELEPVPELYTHAPCMAPLCPSCQRNEGSFGCTGDYPATADGGCEGYIPALRERMMEAKAKPAPVALEICPSCNEHPGCKGTVEPAEDGSCKGFSPKEQPSLEIQNQPSLELPSIILDCTADEAYQKYREECGEVNKAEYVLHSLIELWDCIQAVKTCIEKGGDKQDLYNSLMDDMEHRRQRGLQVDLARRAMLMKNAARWRYSDEVNRLIIESNGHRFTPEGA